MCDQSRRRLERLVIFDGNCAFCSRFFRVSVALLEGDNTAFVASGSETGQKILRRLELPNQPSTVYLVKRGGVLEKSSAVLDLYGEFRRPYCWLKALAILPRGFRDWGYDLIARWRRFLPGGNLSRCELSVKQQKFLIGDDNSDWAVVEDLLDS